MDNNCSSYSCLGGAYDNRQGSLRFAHVYPCEPHHPPHGPPHGHPSAFECHHGTGCALVHEAPGSRPGLYSNMQACAAQCKGPNPIHQSAYECHYGTRCALVHEAPGSRPGLYSNLQDCDAHCKGAPLDGLYGESCSSDLTSIFENCKISQQNSNKVLDQLVNCNADKSCYQNVLSGSNCNPSEKNPVCWTYCSDIPSPVNYDCNDPSPPACPGTPGCSLTPSFQG